MKERGINERDEGERDDGGRYEEERDDGGSHDTLSCHYHVDHVNNCRRSAGVRTDVMVERIPHLDRRQNLTKCPEARRQTGL